MPVKASKFLAYGSFVRLLFMNTVMPRATPMIKATPHMSWAPSTKVSIRFFSDSRLRMPNNRKQVVN